jgi:hypothetical protein
MHRTRCASPVSINEYVPLLLGQILDMHNQREVQLPACFVVTVVFALASALRGWLQIRLLLGMLCASPWRYYPLTLQFLSQQHSVLPKGEQLHTAGCKEWHIS